MFTLKKKNARQTIQFVENLLSIELFMRSRWRATTPENMWRMRKWQADSKFFQLHTHLYVFWLCTHFCTLLIRPCVPEIKIQFIWGLWAPYKYLGVLYINVCGHRDNIDVKLTTLVADNVTSTLWNIARCRLHRSLLMRFK